MALSTVFLSGEIEGEIEGEIDVPDRWLVGQRAGYWNIKLIPMPENFFPDSVDVANTGPAPPANP